MIISAPTLIGLLKNKRIHASAEHRTAAILIFQPCVTTRRHLPCSSTSPFLPRSFLQHPLFCCLVITSLVLSHRQAGTTTYYLCNSQEENHLVNAFYLFSEFSVCYSKVQIHDCAQVFTSSCFMKLFPTPIHFVSATEQPSSLHSSRGFGLGPVEDSWFAPAPEQQQQDLRLHSKLQEEANYHLYGSRMDGHTGRQPGRNVADSRQEERRRRVSHDPFAQQRPYENAQNPGLKGLAYSGAASHGNAVQQPTGLTSQPQLLSWRNGLCTPLGFGASPVDLRTAGPGVWYGPNPGHMPSLYKTPVPETNLLGNTPTIPFSSLPSRGKQAFQSHCSIF